MQKQYIKKKKLRFIINRTSGAKNKKGIEKLIHQNIDKTIYDYELCYTKAAKHATILSKEAADLKYDLVVAVGGDGTINEVAHPLVESSTSLGIIPMGSGNGLARHLKLFYKPLKALKIINQFKARNIDTLKINEHIFLVVAGIGFDAHIAHSFSKLKKRGFFSYAYLVLKDCFRYKEKTFELFLDGKKVIKKGFLFSFANCSQYGNDIIIAPKAKIDDGCFEIALLKKPPLFSIFSTFFHLKKGTIYKSKYFESFKAKEVIIKQKDIKAHIDGEPIFCKHGIKITNFQKLKILVP